MYQVELSSMLWSRKPNNTFSYFRKKIHNQFSINNQHEKADRSFTPLHLSENVHYYLKIKIKCEHVKYSTLLCSELTHKQWII